MYLQEDFKKVGNRPMRLKAIKIIIYHILLFSHNFSIEKRIQVLCYLAQNEE